MRQRERVRESMRWGDCQAHAPSGLSVRHKRKVDQAGIREVFARGRHSGQLTQNSESVRVIAHIAIVAESRAGPDSVRSAGERSPAKDALRALTCLPCTAILRGASIGIVPTVFYPFGSIAQGIINSEAIGPERGDR